VGGGVGGVISYSCYLCFFAYSGVQYFVLICLVFFLIDSES
jgi:hypothetical protein